MEIQRHIKIPDDFLDEIKEILLEVDLEFIPPLSNRKHTLTMDFNKRESTKGIEDYLSAIKEQEIYLLLINDLIAGFISIRKEYTIDIFDGWSPCQYLSTIALKHNYRNKGFGKILYEAALKDVMQDKRCLVTRTWSGNHAHILLAQKLGLTEIFRINDHRGNNIDTIYLGIDFRKNS